jgi:hypothetical protein
MADYEFQGLALPEQMWEAFGAEITQGGKVRFARDGERAAVISAIERARGEADRKEAAIDVARRALRIRAADKPAEHTRQSRMRSMRSQKSWGGGNMNSVHHPHVVAMISSSAPNG